MLKMVYKGKLALWVAIGLKQKTSFMMNSTKTQWQWHSAFHPCTILQQHSCWHCTSPGMLCPHPWTTQVPSYFAACWFFKSLNHAAQTEPQQCQNPALLLPNLHLKPTLQVTCLSDFKHSGGKCWLVPYCIYKKPEAARSHLATWQCPH